MTPVSTTLGEIFQFEVADPSLTDGSALDSRLADRATPEGSRRASSRSTPTAVSSRPTRFNSVRRARRLRDQLEDVFNALERNNLSAGGGYLVHNGEQEVIRGSGLITNLEDVGNIVVGSRAGVPIYIRNLGTVAFAPMIRQGAVTHDGKGETVAGVVMLLIGQNSRTVVDGVKAKLAQIEPTLPSGVKIRAFLRPL